MRCNAVNIVFEHFTDNRKEVKVFQTRTERQSGSIELPLKSL